MVIGKVLGKRRRDHSEAAGLWGGMAFPPPASPVCGKDPQWERRVVRHCRNPCRAPALWMRRLWCLLKWPSFLWAGLQHPLLSPTCRKWEQHRALAVAIATPRAQQPSPSPSSQSFGWDRPSRTRCPGSTAQHRGQTDPPALSAAGQLPPRWAVSTSSPALPTATLPVTGVIYLWPQMKDQYLFNTHTTL